MEIIRSFKELNKNDSLLAGGKGASLGEMTQAGIPVPPGFVILTNAFETFLEATDLNVEIDSILHSVNHAEIHTVETASEKIKALILSAEMPENTANEIQKFFKKLAAKYVAVRSSATAEDSKSAAWAGQLESYLNTTEKNLLENVKKCWASLFTPRAIFYRFEKGFHKQKISVAVVVQKMVQSEKSGIAFSVHPVTEDQNQLIIEAGFGLGEAIVSGKITPDSYVVEKEPRRIIDKNTQTPKQILSDSEILQLSELILKIEKHFGFPCDIEWAFEKGRNYIVQSRAITTLGSKSESFQEYRKIMNRSMFLLACEVWDVGERIKLPEICERAIFFDPLFVYSRGKGVTIYYNFTDTKQSPALGADYFNKHEKLLDELKKKFDQDCDDARTLIEQKDSARFGDLFESISTIWPLLALSYSLGGDERGDKFQTKISLVPTYQAIRKKGDGVLQWGVEALLEEAQKLVPNSYKESVEFLLFDEIKTGNLPHPEELEKRKNGYVYYRGNFYSGETAETFSHRNNFRIIEDTASLASDEVRGSVAFRGKVRGAVKIVLERKDINKVKQGDILVTSMTTPNLISAMNNAAAFVTDEGGITSHAAIIARELKKPCVIGTRVATQIFKDGDIVEVDANIGLVRILK